MYWILLAYVAVNMFGAGYYFSEQRDWHESLREKIGFGFTVFGIMLFGLPVLIIIWICIGVYETCAWINKHLHISFWFGFFVLRRYDNLDNEKLAFYNRVAIQRDKSILRHRLFKIGVKMINQRNNYTYKEPEPNP